MSELVMPVSRRDHIQGNEKAPVTLVEYGDYECPYCGRVYPIVKKIQKTMGGEMRLVFRNFPLAEIHPHARRAALAAEAAGLQDKFWEMHDMLFENQHALEDEDLIGYAEALGLDTEQFIEDMDLEPVDQRVSADFMSGVRSGVNGTPTFFINGKRHDGSYEYADLLSALGRKRTLSPV